ncbi:MAG: phage portal protein [Lachnospiraceae bacterium]|nr:phage portal protein [Lachnospiraceae bacterium]
MGFLDFFRPLKSIKQTRWRELGAYTATFSPFGTDIWQSDLVRSCIRAISEHTSKANAVSNRRDIADILNIHPNMYMSGKDFLSKVRIWLEVKNTVFIYIARDPLTGRTIGFYPVPYAAFEALEYEGRLFIKFLFWGSSERVLVLPWDDLAVLRKDYYTSDIWGDDNRAILNKLDLINTSDQGNANAVRSTANLRGILKATKAMLATDDIRKQKDEFVQEYLNLENSSGIASLDATQDFVPIKMEPIVTDPQLIKEYRYDVFRYYGINDDILMSKYNEDDMEAFYEARIEPFLVALGTELTRKVFTIREQQMKNYIMYESNRIGYASNKTKLNMIQLVDRGILTPNELRQVFNLAPYEGGDEFIRRLDTMPTGETSEEEK